MKPELPLSLYTGQQVKLGELQAAKCAGVEMYTLMLRAGDAVYGVVKQQYPNAKRILILAGTGNNGGDGFVVAKLAKQDGLKVATYVYGDESKISGDAQTAKQEWLASGGVIRPLEMLNCQQLEADVIIDGLLGTGLTGEVRKPLQRIIKQINDTHLPVVAIDTPSGLSSETGDVLGDVVVALHTVTFIGVKQGLTTGQARAVVGDLHFAGLGIEKEFQRIAKASSQFINPSQFKAALPTRRATAHKGDNGRILCLGGNKGYAGAIRLCASASVKSGAGLVRTLCHSSSALPLQVACPEVMTQAWVEEDEALQQALAFADVIAIGPGLGTDTWAQVLYQQVTNCQLPKAVDADGLNLLALQPQHDALRIITPHPGEAARLLACTTREVEQDRFKAVIDLHKKYAGVVVLKGAGTLVYDGQDIYVCQAGSPAMATGGMGDVLTGIIAALIAQGMSLPDAAKFGVLIHSVAADQIAQQVGQIGILASEVAEQARKVINSWLS
ncbi:NAD(P)H-hydrate epimerase [Vibrio galatheae]|uniref:Bifunctional NAD(P)H-hydrate repair enzyme n=1 Tax=Vibrio galatheae TaxID=579748 RepID=A0A0F4NLA6_9VIBR|nr:bifunctional ADP-dependent NAD(P)H-hydrate dehydratase/NAD(P)H-hydrate epimerase [Vibrio galatheae]KJY82826.1 NAD(P)H-hydrate epimerase [Vibrio galatheae]